MTISLGFSFAQNSDGSCHGPNYHNISIDAHKGLEDLAAKIGLECAKVAQRMCDEFNQKGGAQ